MRIFFDENRQSLQGYLPDNTVGTYEYVVNPNLIRVADWAQRVTSYTYDENNRVVGVTKPDGSVKTTAYDNKQRVISTVERTAAGAVITGFEYIYDDLSRIVEEKEFADSIKKCYTYDSVSSYKGKLVIRTDMDRSGSLGILFISHNEDTAWDRIDTIKHEFGHTKQLEQMGLVNYLILIGLPSWQKWGADSYYRKPWEITADIYGGVNLSSRICDEVLT